MEKKKYIVPELNATLISECDIITASGIELLERIKIGTTNGSGDSIGWDRVD